MNKTIKKLLGIILSYLTGFLVGLTGALILYIESPSFLTCKYTEECETRECPINCILEKRWAGFVTTQKENIQDFKGISSKSKYQKAQKSGQTGKYYYNLVIKHRLGETDLTPPAGENHHFPSRDAISQKVNDFTNTGPANESLIVWQSNWLMMLIGYSLMAIWPLQMANILLNVKKKFFGKM